MSRTSREGVRRRVAIRGADAFRSLSRMRLDTNEALLRRRLQEPAEKELAAAIRETFTAGHDEWYCAECVTMHSARAGCGVPSWSRADRVKP